MSMWKTPLLCILDILAHMPSSLGVFPYPPEDLGKLFQSFQIHSSPLWGLSYLFHLFILSPAFPLEGKLLETGSYFIFSIWYCRNMNVSTYWALMF